jgi:uncharacterized membrane protein
MAAAAEVAARPLMELGPLLEIIPAALVTRHPRRFPHEKAAPMKTLFATVLSISIAVALPGLAEARGGGHGGGGRHFAAGHGGGYARAGGYRYGGYGGYGYGGYGP